MITYRVPGNISKWSVTVVWSILEIYLLCIYCLQPRTDHWKVLHVYGVAATSVAPFLIKFQWQSGEPFLFHFTGIFKCWCLWSQTTYQETSMVFLQVFIVLSLKKIKIFISYTLWHQGNFSCRSQNFPCYPLVGQLEMRIQIRMAKKALIQNVAYGPWMLLEGTDRKFLEEGALSFILCILLFFCWKC